MSDLEQIDESSRTIEKGETKNNTKEKKSFIDYLSLFITTCLVGYLPLAPGTWGSIVGVLIYLGYGSQIKIIESAFVTNRDDSILFSAISYFVTGFLLLLICLIGIWASKKVEKLLNDKDPQIIVVDEVMGQLITFAFVPFGVSWRIILAGFILFRLFDMWKPYPIRNVENLSNGIGVCADDIVAGVYAGICLSLIYALTLMI